mmetsp:Transcript_39015/g.86806  ORF Transcript_39015/g.86806 Transcript_39015/m.86806 type:complete len:863 (-) Transcript_39015:1327-3915(-)
MKNADLHKYRGSGFLAQPSTADKLFKFLAQLLLLAIWKSCMALSVPFGKVFALYFWTGKKVCTLSLHLEKQLLKLIGWFSGTAFSRDTRVGRLSRYYFAADLKRWHVGVAALVCTGVISSILRKVTDSFDERVKRQKYFKRLMSAASSYEQWRELAEQLQKLEERDEGAHGGSGFDESRLYDRKLLQQKLHHLRRMKATGNAKEIMFALRVDLMRNVANIAKSKLHERYYSIPQPIQRYLREVKDQLFQLRDWPGELSVEEKLAFFKETRHAFGRTALLLSGGGGLGTFHIGVCKALFEGHLLPRVLAGSSVGSIVSAIIGTRTDMELRELFSKLDQFDIGFFNNSRAVELLHHLINKGSLHDMAFMIKKLRNLLGDMTFLEAYEKTGRILNVTVCPADTNEPPRLLNYMTAPHALVWSAVAASSAFPGLFPAQHLVARNSNGEVVMFSAQGGNEERRWRDGSLELDLPVQALAEMFNCNHFLVSQTNPHIVPILNIKKMMTPNWANVFEAEIKLRCQQLQWVLPEWIPTKWLTLFTQPWEGDITMTLPHTLWDLPKTIVNPTTEELLRSVKVGEVATWEKMSAIECNCTIEAALDNCLAKTKNQLRGKPVAKVNNRIPSWLHMPSVGLPVVASWGENLVDLAQVSSWGDMDMADSAMDVPVSSRHVNGARTIAAAAGLPPVSTGPRLETIPSMRSLAGACGVAAGSGSVSTPVRVSGDTAEAFDPHTPTSSAKESATWSSSMCTSDDDVTSSGTMSSAPVSSGEHAPSGAPAEKPKRRPAAQAARKGRRSSARSSVSGASSSQCTLKDKDLLAMAQMDCTDSTAGDLWSQLLPLAGQCVGLSEQTEAAGAAAGDAIDVYAY